MREGGPSNLRWKKKKKKSTIRETNGFFRTRELIFSRVFVGIVRSTISYTSWTMNSKSVGRLDR